MKNILSIVNLSKKFNNHEVITNLNLEVPEHTICGFVGKNGVGKTTTIKMILGFLKADRGKIKICEEEVKFGETKTNKYIGYLQDVPEFYSYMNACEYLSLCGEIMGMSKIEIKNKSDELLNLVGLKDANNKIGTYSRGMKQRLGIAQALLKDPKLLICDEPTSALDPLGRKEILDILLNVKEKTTIIFSTHILSDIEKICDSVAVLSDGYIVLNETLQNLKKQYKKESILLEFYTEKAKEEFIKNFNNLKIKDISLLEKSDLLVKILVKNVDEIKEKCLKIILSNHIEFSKIEVVEPNIENLLLEVIK